MAILSREEFESDIAHGRFAAVYLLLGSESYLVRRAVALLKQKAVPEEARAFNLVELTGGSGSASIIVHEANTFPFLSERRLVLVSRIDETPAEEQDVLLRYFSSPQAKTVLALCAEEMDRRTVFYRRLAELASVVEFKKLKGPELERWASAQLSRRGCRISPSALSRLVDLAGADLSSLMNEIEKLLLYAGSEKQIGDAEIDLLAPASRKHGVFEMTAAIGRKDRKNALRLLGNVLESGEAPLAVLGAMARMFRQIIIAKELLAAGRPAAEIGRAAQVPDFVLADFIKQVHLTDLDVARQTYRELALLDRRFKSSGADERMLLEKLICSL